MKIAVLGTRGFPQIQGGVEAHCENLYPRLVKLGCEVVVFGRKPYMGDRDGPQKAGTVPVIFKGVKIIPLSCPKNKFLEAFIHTLKGVFWAKKMRPDILHIHAVGPSLLVPLARMLGLRVVMTHHGPDYERKKWGKFAKIVLKLGEYLGCIFADEVIAVSNYIAEGILKKYGKRAIVIPNGVETKRDSPQKAETVPFGLKKGKYILAVGRFVPEKGFRELMEAFKVIQGQSPSGTDPSAKSGDSPCLSWKLVIVGNADHEDKYSQGLKELAKKTPGVVLTGFLSGQALQELYSHAGLFVLSSYYEGLPIVLLEAMSYGLPCLASDIPANRNVDLPQDRFFKAGDIQGLAEKIMYFTDKPLTEDQKAAQIRMIAEKYDWEKIAGQTLEVYKRVK